jgi:hypothetical protein
LFVRPNWPSPRLCRRLNFLPARLFVVSLGFHLKTFEWAVSDVVQWAIHQMGNSIRTTQPLIWMLDFSFRGPPEGQPDPRFLFASLRILSTRQLFVCFFKKNSAGIGSINGATRVGPSQRKWAEEKPKNVNQKVQNKQKEMLKRPGWRTWSSFWNLTCT